MPYKQFITYLEKEKRYSAKTCTAYSSDLQQFFAFAQNTFDTINVKEINTQMVRSWIAEMVENGTTASSVKRKLSAVKSFYKYEQQNGTVLSNPASGVATPKIPKRLPKTVDTKAVNFLLEKTYFGETFVANRDKLVIEIIYETGMRVSELCSLKVYNIFLEENTLKVIGKGNKERLIPFSDLLKNSIEKYLKVRNNEPFDNADLSFLIVTEKGKPAYNKLISRITKKYLSLITKNEHRNPHVLRHTYASALLNNGADLNAIKELLGHSSLAATQVYTHNSVEQLKKTYFLTHPKT